MSRQAIAETENAQDPTPIVTSDHFLQALALMGVPEYEEKQKRKRTRSSLSSNVFLNKVEETFFSSPWAMD